MKGRPLRFLAGALAIWVFARSAALWPVEHDADAVDSPAPIPSAIAAIALRTTQAGRVAPAVMTPRADLRCRLSNNERAAHGKTDRRSQGAGTIHDAVPTASLTEQKAASEEDRAASQAILPIPVAPPPAARPPSIAARRGRLAGSLWGIVRGGSSSALLGGQLGGSQAGLRVTYALDRRRRLALAARLSTPLNGAGREAAIGIDWQPTAVPIHLIAERRMALDGGRGGPMLGVIGGFGPTTIRGSWRAEGYAQAGVIHRDAAEGFADGSLRITRSVVDRDGVRVDIGGGVWGGIQHGARRLDLGPTLGLSLPAGARRLRIAADWRQRIAGEARPGSGPAISLGSDF
ncbi:hypothetical protein [Sphingomonas sp. GV3]|uniref:hypothetical protein n=1 Tax=Sphingomonas sp. GV3 TaxID=3040671 RepID=UPI00280AC07B|nr:hypothetical protein [Sphingomonas sp. GV3]